MEGHKTLTPTNKGPFEKTILSDLEDGECNSGVHGKEISISFTANKPYAATRNSDKRNQSCNQQDASSFGSLMESEEIEHVSYEKSNLDCVSVSLPEQVEVNDKHPVEFDSQEIFANGDDNSVTASPCRGNQIDQKVSDDPLNCEQPSQSADELHKKTDSTIHRECIVQENTVSNEEQSESLHLDVFKSLEMNGHKDSCLSNHEKYTNEISSSIDSNGFVDKDNNACVKAGQLNGTSRNIGDSITRDSCPQTNIGEKDDSVEAREKVLINGTDKCGVLVRSDPTDEFEFQEDGTFVASICGPFVSGNRNVEQSSENGVKLGRKEGMMTDPFRLSGDEDFSPKAYKPIKRKLGSQGMSECQGDRMDFFHNLLKFDDEKENSIEFECKKHKGNSPVSEMRMPNRQHRVAYVYSKELVESSSKLIRIEGRAKLVHSLIEVYGILQHVEVIPPRLATEAEITGFHCPLYIDFLKGMTDSEDLSDSDATEAEAYGLSYDCPLQKDVFETAALISGGTIVAAESLVSGAANIAINWCGGWHHAKRDGASGFCYINDIALGILKLRERFDKVLYVDLDLHHGDGVEEAFYTTPKVMTVSFHKYALGFFPGSGCVEDMGSGRGKLHTVNVPLMDGIGDAQFYSIFTSVMRKVREKFSGEAIVVQCGADTLCEDPMASFNLTHVGIAKCVCFLLTWNLPTLLLGGGGYNFPNTAKCWTFLTAVAAGKRLPVDIPEHEHLLEYGPSYELTTFQGNRKDCNTKEHFMAVIPKIYKNLNSL